jgi:hypothetical protein
MIRGFVYAVLFVFVGAILFSLAAPFIYPRNSDFEKIGYEAAGFIFPICGGGGFLTGWIHSKQKRKR